MEKTIGSLFEDEAIQTDTINAFAGAYNYTGEDSEGKAQTKEAFFVQCLIKHLREVGRGYEKKQLRESLDSGLRNIDNKFNTKIR